MLLMPPLLPSIPLEGYSEKSRRKTTPETIRKTRLPSSTDGAANIPLGGGIGLVFQGWDFFKVVFLEGRVDTGRVAIELDEQ
jgi:hypothetical protein